MTSAELKKIILDKYGAFPDFFTDIATEEHFDPKDWEAYCTETFKLLKQNLPKREFFNRLFALPIHCGYIYLD